MLDNAVGSILHSIFRVSHLSCVQHEPALVYEENSATSESGILANTSQPA